MRQMVFTLALLLMLVSALAVRAAEQSDLPLLLKSRQFFPQKGLSPQDLATIQGAGRQQVHVIIQFSNIPSPEARATYEREGIRLLSYLPENAWFASLPPAAAGSIAQKSEVTALLPIRPQDRLSPLLSGQSKGMIRLYVLFFPNVPEFRQQQLLNLAGASFLREADHLWDTLLPAGQLLLLAQQDDIQWIESYHPPPQRANDGSRAAINVNPVHSLGITGSGVTIAEWDGGWVETTHPDFQGRLIIGDAGCSEPACQTNDHATHVGGTAAGSGSRSAGRLKGMAPSSRLISYEWPDTTISEMDLETFQAIKNYRIVLSQNSWSWAINSQLSNCNLLGDYDLFGQNYDAIVTGKLNEEISVVFSAGNHGAGGYGCQPGYSTITSPGGAAKNTLAVGSVDSDTLSVSSFSSRGPTDDGRLKPDLVAAGCENGNDFGINSTVPPSTYGVMCGTSMAAPAVSGTIALLHEKWRQYFTADPLPSTVKALLIQTAQDLNTSGPSFADGYGLVDALAAINLISQDGGQNQNIIEGQINHNEIQTLYLTVPPGSPPLDITLAWDDYPGTVNAYKNLVNNIHIWLIDPQNTIHRPWILDPSNPSAPAGKGVDSYNNVEKITVLQPLPGTWKLKVFGESIPQGPQTYSLASDLDLSPECGSNPVNNCIVTQSTTFNPGTYLLPNGITISNDFVTLDCNGAVLDGSGGPYLNIAIVANNTRNIIIRNCNVMNYWWGVYSNNALNNRFDGNSFLNNGVGIDVRFSTGVHIENNLVHGIGARGVDVTFSTGSVITNNTLLFSGYTGIRLYNASGNTISQNTIHENSSRRQGYGISLIYSATNNTIAFNTIQQHFTAIQLLVGPAGNTVTQNILTDNDYGLSIHTSSSNTFAFNTIARTRFDGIYVRDDSSGNSFYTNQIINNFFGIHVLNASGNSFYTNQIINNSGQAYEVSSNSSWDNGSIGNHWGNYDQENEGCFDFNRDGICDSPYLLSYNVTNNNGIDNYPLYGGDGSGNSLCGSSVPQNMQLSANISCPAAGFVLNADNLLFDCAGHSITGNGNFIGVDVQNRKNITITNCSVQNFSKGVSILNVMGALLANNIAAYNSYGFYLSGVSRGSFANNTALGNAEGFIAGFSPSNAFLSNIAMGNRYGFRFTFSSFNNLSDNIILGNGVGIELPFSTQNTIANNMFNNTVNAQINTQNIWNGTRDCSSGSNIIGGPCLGGNAWSDYQGMDLDGDGIGDTQVPYTTGIQSGGDFLPLTTPTPGLSVQGLPKIGTRLTFSLADVTRPNTPYLLFLALGTSPGIRLSDGRTIPLNFDGLAQVSLLSPQLIGLSNSQAALDGQGGGTVTWDIPPLPLLAGLNISAAYVTYYQNETIPQAVKSISPPVSFILTT